MALTLTITKVDARNKNGVFQITLNLKINDGISDVIDQDFSEVYSKRKSDTLAMVKERLRAQMQAAIDENRITTATPNNTKIDAAIADLENSLVL